MGKSLPMRRQSQETGENAIEKENRSFPKESQVQFQNT